MGDGRHLGLGFGRHRGRIFGFVLLAVASAAAAASPFGCGLDDTAITQFGADAGGTDGTVVVQGEGGPVINDSGQPDAVACNPETCANYPSVCRSSLPDNCGKTINCMDACPSGQACLSDSGTCDGPPICKDAGAPGGNCGTLTNPGNTSLTASCGNCANNGYSCTTSTCVCSPGGTVCGANCCNAQTAGGPNCNSTNDSCCTLNNTCAAGTCSATNDNHCGGNFSCANNCTTAGQACAPDKVCDTTPTCTNKGTNGGPCGTYTSAHGLTADCGGCNTPNYTCTGTPGTCTCTPESQSTTCTNNPTKCGMVPNNCGIATDCGGCGNGDMCEGTAQCNCGFHGVKCNPGQTCDTSGADKCD